VSNPEVFFLTDQFSHAGIASEAKQSLETKTLHSGYGEQEIASLRSQ
jgi:hypothetical protein